MKIIKFKAILLALLIGLSSSSMAQSAASLDHDANMAINKFIDEVKGGDPFLVKAKAFLVFPSIKEAGFFVGGKYGEGVLRVGRTTKGYYRITSASFGMQIGAQESSMIIAFNTDKALNTFLMSDDDWETEIDGKIAVAEWNSKEEDLDDINFEDPIVAFVFDSTGLMGSFTMEGTKFERIKPD
ncbi:MAG: lipid-binding SYLF domain-containing protein [Campylobacterota bacterium]|nr:lipid-binding SYLF domain-containing protein [Campylobacterota bacterium]